MLYADPDERVRDQINIEIILQANPERRPIQLGEMAVCLWGIYANKGLTVTALQADTGVAFVQPDEAPFSFVIARGDLYHFEDYFLAEHIVWMTKYLLA